MASQIIEVSLRTVLLVARNVAKPDDAIFLARIIREITAEEQASSVVANGPVP